MALCDVLSVLSSAQAPTTNTTSYSDYTYDLSSTDPVREVGNGEPLCVLFNVTVAAGSLLGMLLPILNFLVGTLLFHECLSLRGLLGSVIVIVSCLWVIVSDRKDQNTGEQLAGGNAVDHAPQP